MNTASSNLAVFSMDAEALKAHHLVERAVGDLELPDGRLIAMDPLVVPDMEPYKQTVPPGTYPVTVIMGDEEGSRPALLVIRFSDEPVVDFTLATRPGQDMEELEDGYIFGTPVDTGLAAFANTGFFPAVEKREAEEIDRLGEAYSNYYDNVLAETMPGTRSDEYLVHHPVEGESGAAAISQSGWGDGFYPVIWGFGGDGAPALAFIDFRVIEDGEGKPEEVTILPEAFAGMTAEQRVDNVKAYAALLEDDMAEFAAYVEDQRITPEEPAIPAEQSFMAEAIRLNNAEALKIMIDAGASPTPGPADEGWIETYYGYAQVLDKSARTKGKIPPRSDELMALLRQLESGNAGQ